MDSVERVRRALHFLTPDRIPLVMRTTTENSDIVNTGYNAPEGWQEYEPGLDEWGRRWLNIIGTGLGQIVAEPLHESSLDGYTFPNPQIASRFAGIEKTVAAFPGRYIAASLGLSGFTCMMSLRGYEALMCDLLVEPAFVEQLADAVFRFEAEIIRQYAKRGVHGVWLYDDLGTASGPMVSPELFKRVFLTRYSEQAHLVHSLGMDYLLHSCGDVWELLPDLTAAGFDLLNLEQPLIFSTAELNGIDRLAATWGGRICFCTNADSQRTLISGPAAAIASEIEHLVRALAKPEGGLILLADCGADHHIAPPGHLAAQKEACLRAAGLR
ncbi:MAG: uroporphyrinogen decarboxylase family protein [Anaerolineae bacterium]